MMRESFLKSRFSRLPPSVEPDDAEAEEELDTFDAQGSTFLQSA
jgi:hypothetical protein